MTKLQRVKATPSWFSLDKYSGSKNLSNKEWGKQLQIRSEILSELIFNGEFLFTRDWIEQIRKNGLVIPERPPFEEINTSSPLDQLVVVPISTLELAVKGEGLLYKLYPDSSPTKTRAEEEEIKKREHSRKQAQDNIASTFLALTGEDTSIEPLTTSKEFNRKEFDPSTPYDSYKEQYIGEPTDFINKYSYIKINLDFPDSEIKEAFGRFLPEYRSLLDIKPGTSKIVSKSNIYNLSSYQILPYLDLLIWERENGYSLNKRIYADALFPDNDERDKDFLEQTVKVSAHEFMSESFTAMLFRTEERK